MCVCVVYVCECVVQCKCTSCHALELVSTHCSMTTKKSTLLFVPSVTIDRPSVYSACGQTC